MDLYTRCPHCQTVFRLASEQLDAAGGRVRCGACLRVFPARQSLVRPRANPAASAGNAVPSANLSGHSKTPTAAVPTRPATPTQPTTPTPVAKPVSPTATATTPAAKPANKPQPSPGPNLDFDSFFAAPSTQQPAPAAATPAAPVTSVTPPREQPTAPDFSLLTAALNELNLASSSITADAPAATDNKAEPLSSGVPERSAERSSVGASEPAAKPVAANPDASEPVAAEPVATAQKTQAAPSLAPSAAVQPVVSSPDFEQTDIEQPGFARQQTAAEPESAAPAPDEPDFLLDQLPYEPAQAEPTQTGRLEPKSADAASTKIKSSDSESADTGAGDIELAGLAMPDDWASLKPAPRTEPVFDDDNGLDHELPLAGTVPPAPVKSPSVTLAQTPPPDKATERAAPAAAPKTEPMRTKAPEPTPIVAAADPASDPTEAPLDWLQPDPAPTARAPQRNAPATPATSNMDRYAPAKPSLKDAEIDEFEFNLDAIDAASAEPTIFGDWQVDHGETVKHAADSDRLVALPDAAPERSADASPMSPVAGASAEPPMPAAPHADALSAGVPAGTAATMAATGFVAESDTLHADFGDISQDWDRPPIALQPPAVASVQPITEAQPEPFDADSFTADPADRVYAPALDTGDSSNWTLTSTEPREDYEPALFATPKRRLPWRGLLLTLLALLLLPVLVVQLLWPQRAELRNDPQWGPWVESLCQHIDCELPPRTDLSKIELQQRSVLKDRDDPRKLQIDLLVANKADFAQPYPDINLRFTNIEGELVAERRFRPQEYLRDMPASDQMPVKVPIHIAFSVKAPDGNITGFEFSFLPPQ